MVTIEEIFCAVDDFCQNNKVNYSKIELEGEKKSRKRDCKLSCSETMTILIYYQFSKFRDFKSYYLQYVCSQLQSAFPDLISYNRFIELIPRIFPNMIFFLQEQFEEPIGIAYIDSTELPVCHKKRIKQHKVFDGIASIGKSSKGWFLGLKLHLLVNHQGGLIAAKITPGSVDDRSPVTEMAENIFGKLYGDKGYISSDLTKKLKTKGISLITSSRQNMKPKIMSLFDKLALRKRVMIESINNQMKNVFQVEHTRHCKPINAFCYIVASLVAYCFYPNKTSAKIDFNKMGLLDVNS